MPQILTTNLAISMNQSQQSEEKAVSGQSIAICTQEAMAELGRSGYTNGINSTSEPASNSSEHILRDSLPTSLNRKRKKTSVPTTKEGEVRTTQPDDDDGQPSSSRRSRKNDKTPRGTTQARRPNGQSSTAKPNSCVRSSDANRSVRKQKSSGGCHSLNGFSSIPQRRQPSQYQNPASSRPYRSNDVNGNRNQIHQMSQSYNIVPDPSNPPTVVPSMTGYGPLESQTQIDQQNGFHLNSGPQVNMGAAPAWFTQTPFPTSQPMSPLHINQYQISQYQINNINGQQTQAPLPSQQFNAPSFVPGFQPNSNTNEQQHQAPLPFEQFATPTFAPGLRPNNINGQYGQASFQFQQQQFTTPDFTYICPVYQEEKVGENSITRIWCPVHGAGRQGWAGLYWTCGCERTDD